MVRTFIAAEPGGELIKQLSPVLAGMRSAAPRVKWVEQDNLHLTFRFLGDIPEPDLADLFATLEEMVSGFPPFALEVSGIGAFPHWRHPRVVWAGCGDGADEAMALAELVEEACLELGYEREKRPFRPHLTVGRVKLPADAMGLEDAVYGLRDKVFGYVDVDSVVVFMSSLRRTGPVYSPMARIPLSGH